nr:hypothetical protein [Deltaproteobacteria bacterium]
MATASTSTTFLINGTVFDSEGEPAAGIRVVATDTVGPSQPIPAVLVSASTDADGAFSLELNAQVVLGWFRSGFDPEQGARSRPMASRSRSIALIAYSHRAVVGRLDLAVSLDGLADGYDIAFPINPSGEMIAIHRGRYQVAGLVRDSTGRPVAGHTVEVLHQRLRDESVIAATHSGADGSFRMRYDAAEHVGEGAQALAIVVRTLHDPGTGELVEQMRTARMCPAPSFVELELELPRTTPLATEFERVGALIEARRQGVAFTELTDDDIELIACETGLPLDEATAYVRAGRLAEGSELPAAALYALERRGLTTSVAVVGALPSGVLRQALAGAASQELVPAWTDLDGVVAMVSSTMAARAGEDSDDAPLGQLLAATGLPADIRGTFVAEYVGRTGTVEEFWQTFSSTHSAEDVARTRFSLATGALTHGHLPLVVALEQRRQAGEIASARDLAGWTTTQWQQLVSGTAGAGAPAEYPGHDDAQRESLYAVGLARAVEEAFPTAALIDRTAQTGRWGLAASYVAEHPELDFRRTNARSYLADHPAAGLSPQDQEALLLELSQAQRLFMVAPRFDRDAVAGPLLDAGIHSAQQIAAMGVSAFVEQHGAAIGGEAIAKVVYDNAHHVASTVAVLATNHAAPFSPVAFPGVGEEGVDPGDAPPDLQGLFGSLDLCACEHCRSVLSPAAYYVDVLRFVEQRPALDDEQTAGVALVPFAALVARRPDLRHVLLDCANTNTVLPAIDLVNELLEQEVVGGAPDSWPQTTRSTEELRGQPEHRIDAAYDALRAAVFPLSLPFDLARAESEAFLGRLGASRVELLEACGSTSEDVTTATTHARLGLETTAARIVAGEDLGHSWQALWGLAETATLDTLIDAPEFFARTGLDLHGFDQMAATNYVGGGELSISFETPCQLEGATIDGLDEARLDRIHRSLRLTRALGWSMTEVDTAISMMGSAGPNPLDAECFRALSRLLALEQRFGSLPRRELMVWFGDLSTDPIEPGERSHHDEIFAEPSAQGEVSPLAFGQAEQPMTAVLPQLAAALGRPEAEVARLLALDPTRSTTTVANLSWLYRWSSLARAVGLSIFEVGRLVELSGVAPFSAVGASALDGVERFVGLVDALSHARVSVAGLDALLRHQGREPSGLGAGALAGLIVELVRGLQAVRSELAAAVEPAQSRLAVLVDQLPRVMTPGQADAVMAVVRTIPETTPEPDAYASWPVPGAAFLSTPVWHLLQDAASEGDPLADPEYRAGLVLEPLVPFLRQRLMEGVVVRKLAAVVQLSPG